MILRLARFLLLALALALPAGCTTVSSLNSAARSLDVYELQPATAVPGSARTTRSVTVAAPAASAAVASDRILVKPNPLQVTYLPGARWVEAAPEHLQSLLVRSLEATGRTGFVGASGSGALTDYVLDSRIEAFEAQIVPRTEPPVRVLVALTLTLVNDVDGRRVASRRFERAVDAGSDAAPVVVSAFNLAMSGVLGDATAWTIATMAGR
jgi:cholesterol transport system auxiliary component